MSQPWFRMYHEFMGDPVIQGLAFEDQRHYVMVLCFKASGLLDREFPSREVRERMICRALGLDPLSGAEANRRLREFGLVDLEWQPPTWDKRQFRSDTSTSRVQRFREKREEKKSDTDSDTDTDTERNVTRNVSETFQQCFGRLRAIYPKRSGSQPWPKAEKAIHARLTEGATWDEILAGAERYAEFCRSTGKVGTEFVMQASTFCGPDNRFREDWLPPQTRAQSKQDANVAASVAWLEGNR